MSQPDQSSAAPIRESEATQVFLVLGLLLDVAYHDGSARDLAVADEAYALAGYFDPAVMISHAPRDEALARFESARRGRHSRLLRHGAQGLLYAVRALVHEGVLDGSAASRRQNERWIERGGHDRAA